MSAMRCLALDVGERRIGLATGDSALGLATPLAVLTRRGLERDLAAIEAAAQQSGAEAVVVGLAQPPDEPPLPRTAAVLRLVEALRARLAVPVLTWSEAYTTYEALERRRALGRRGRRLRAGIDAEAAAILLESYFRAGSA
ncbi:MAG: Holliday junction resolvase RuvX [Chloroflexi bacterium]|nr:Holliday junction resolvase RuvX [Chloroflexota bacterium]